MAKANENKRGLYLVLAVAAGLGVYLMTRASPASAPGTPNGANTTGGLFSYTQGTVTMSGAPDSNMQGFSFQIAVNGTKVYSDSIVTGDAGYTNQGTGGYVINFTPLNDSEAAIFVYDSTGNQLAVFNVYFNGSLV